MASGPICAMVWEGRDAVKTGRSILGATNPLASAPGTIRGDYALVRFTTPQSNRPMPRLFDTPLESLHVRKKQNADDIIGRRPQRLPRQRQCRECQEGDRALVQGGRGPDLEVGSARLGVREVDSPPYEYHEQKHIYTPRHISTRMETDGR
jgi:hypothetical protein